MKVGTAPRGSFGIPQEHQEILRKKQEEKEEAREEAAAEEEASEEQPPVEQPSLATAVDPVEVIRKLVGDFTAEDFNNYIFKGCIEKELVLVKNPVGKDLAVTIRSLSGKDYDDVDELVAEDIQTLKMTADMLPIRRNMWVLSFGVTKFNGKPLVTPILDAKGNLDRKASARAKRAVISELAAEVIDKLTHIHVSLTIALKQVVENPEKTALKKS